MTKWFTDDLTVTIVTVVKNDGDGIENTVLSVVNQSYKNIQYIVVDGGSKDNTMAVVNKYRGRISEIVSELDYGIYDAMNKSLPLINGEWVLFLNSGDFLVNSEVIRRVVDLINKKPSAKIIRGWSILLTNNGAVRKRFKSLASSWKGLPHSHQAQFVCSCLAKKHPFNTKYRYSADFDFFLTLMNNKVEVVEYDAVVSVCDYRKGFSKNPNLYVLYRDFIDIHLNRSSWWVIVCVLTYVPIELALVNIKKISFWRN